MALKKAEAVKEVVESTIDNVTEKEVASVDRLNKAIDLMLNKFGLDEDYVLTAFQDKGSSVNITMNNQDFEVSCTIKRPYEYGFELPNN